MIKSMTGFAALTREDERATIAVTIRAVNHRHLDLQLRSPHALSAIEGDLRALVAKHVARGRVEVSVSLQLRQVTGVDVEFNEEFARSLEVALDKARERGLVSGQLTPGDLLKMPQAITIRERQPEDDEETKAGIAAQAREAVEQALVDLDAMRSREGVTLRGDLDSRRIATADFVERIAAAADEGRAAMEQRVTERVRELRTELQADETAVAQEIVRMAARSDISEELERFRGHVSHWEALAGSPEPCGRKLDFLLQEMNRESNTIGAKSPDTAVSHAIVEIKAEIERMREQVQNVE